MDFMRMDLILMEILTERKTITGFLDAIFGFLKRNTDFYLVKERDDDQVGFAKGVRERILFEAMQRYDPEYQFHRLTGEDMDEAPPVLEEVEVVTESEEDRNSDPKASQRKEQTQDVVDDEETTVKSFSRNDYKNGAAFSNYCWSQSLKDVELQVRLPPNLKTAKDIEIEFKSDRIAVKSRTQPEVIVVGGQLHGRYKHNDAVWTIVEGRLVICFDKAREVWWEKLFSTEPEIDVKKIDCECYIDELPESSQAAIEKLRLQQREQDLTAAQSNPDAEELEQMARLRLAWDAEGSPFRGQPFDPSLIKFT